jgi:hypothetical protein
MVNIMSTLSQNYIQSMNNSSVQAVRCWDRNVKKPDIQGDQKVSVHLMITVQKTIKNIFLNSFSHLKTATTEYIRNVDRAILNTVFENTVWRVNKCLENGGGH